ncbi:MAG: hypothetical protein FWF12_00115 [Betaproteobacteria bacterium]|nr:hypothetical protein [Betaproteobacteria bacterium]
MTKKVINFNISAADDDLIHKIVLRCEEAGTTKLEDRLTLEMDMAACHASICKLDLRAMLEWRGSMFDLTHDVLGIHNLLDRETGGFETGNPFRHHWWPRFAVVGRCHDGH